ncbi:MAG: transporter [Dehalococcoidia bacterium]|nr:transporter [Dehalococcoidia bacterium]
MKKRFLLLSGMALGAAFGAKVIASKWPKHSKSSNGNGSKGAVEALEMVAVYSRGAELHDFQAHSNGSAVAADTERLGVVTLNGGSPTATAVVIPNGVYPTATAEEKVGISVEDAPSVGPQAATHGAPAKFSLKTFESLKYRDYRFLWFSIVATSAGQWMQQIALSWLVYQMTDSPFMLGAINGVRALPFLFFGPWAGVAADRMDRKWLMQISQGYIGVLTLVMGLLIVSGMVQVWHLFAFTLLSGAGWSFTMPVRQTLIPNLVPRESLMNAVALQSAAFNSTRVLGPTVAGLLIAWIGVGGTFMVQVPIYFIIFALIAVIKIPPTPVDARRSSAGQNMVEGFRYIGGNQAVFSLIVLALVPMLLAMPFQSLIPVFARDILGMGPKGFGILVSFAGIGALSATLAVASLGDFKYKGILLFSALAALGVALVLFSQSTWLPLSLFLMVLVGGFQMTYMSLNNTLIHLNITDNMRGRVMSIYMLDQGLTPLGTLFAGGVAQLAGAPLAVTIMGCSCLILALIAMAKIPIVRRLA